MHYKNPMQVFFIIHPGTLGDVVLAFPAIQAMKGLIRDPTSR